MEIRGIGIIDAKAMFGIGSVVDKKDIFEIVFKSIFLSNVGEKLEEGSGFQDNRESIVRVKSILLTN